MLKNYLAPVLLICPLFCIAQTVAIKGVVQDLETREMLPHTNVSLSGKTTGTTTDLQGNFSLAASPGDRLVISFVGYKTDTVSVVSGKEFYRVHLTPDLHSLREVLVVSATMKEVTKMNSPIPVEIYSPALFMKNPTPGIFEALNMVNGVQPQMNCSVCNTGDIHINGMEGPYTMLLIDGMPIVSSLATVYGLAGIPNSMVKRIEIVKGPASTLYGSEAVGGLINIITKDPASSPRLHLDLSATSVEEFNADLSAKMGFRKAEGLLGINYFNYQNRLDINSDNFTDITQQNRISVFNKWDIKRKENRQASIAGRYVYEDRWGGQLQWNRSLRGSAEVYGESIYTNRVEVIGNYQLPVKDMVMWDYSYNYHKQDSYYGEVSYLADQHVFFTQLRMNKKLGKHDLLMGIPFRFTHYDDNTPGTKNTDGSNKPDRIFLPGIFVQDEFTLSRGVTFLGGLRYDRNNEHGNILSPRLSAKITTGESSTLRISGGNGYRVVNLFTEDHAALTGSRQVIIQEELNPEQSWNINVNYATILNHKYGYASLDGSVFYTYFTNKIVGDFLSDPNLILYKNLRGHAVSRGITLNAELAFTNHVKFIGGVTFMDVYQMEPVSGDELEKLPQLFAPRVSGTYTLSYVLPESGLTFDFTGRTNGPMELPVHPDPSIDPRPSRSPWYSIMNFQVTKTWDNGLEIYGGVKNLLNFVPDHPILFAHDPTSEYFDASYNYAPVQGIKGFAGIRLTIQ